MTTDTRIPVPTFEEAVAALLEVVSESPQATHRHAYLDNLNLPFDLTATWLARLDAPIVAAAQGTYEFNGTKRFNNARLTTLWNRLFVSYDGDETPLPYDWPHIGFFGMARVVQVAEWYQVYVLMNKVQRANDGGLDWRGSAVRALKSTRRLMHSKTSGARVQLGIAGSSPAHEEMWQNVDSLIAKALASLNK
ncbi:hypothetical protein SEA_EDEN_23 [Microbacterium phage Eden]|uniref:Uncharacterized protein n=1 Tax=Microbacterium phage Eden TaxID=2250289 RepID=A0A345KWB6_9CAUD|nr:hypothetical protein HOT71_gp23 [Microbacterium phage Eden]AXH47318.1 hypothetical protein SEA_EDEN_23 [Microbacterium phage Eden]